MSLPDAAVRAGHATVPTPIIMKGLDGTQLAPEDYEARGGYEALKKILEREDHARAGRSPK